MRRVEEEMRKRERVEEEKRKAEEVKENEQSDEIKEKNVEKYLQINLQVKIHFYTVQSSF